MTEQQIPLYHLKQWMTGNVMGEPLMTIETTEGLKVAVVMPVKSAKELAAALEIEINRAIPLAHN